MVGLHITRVAAKIMQALEKASLGSHSIGRWFSRMGLSQAYDRAHHLNDRIAASSAPSVFSGPRRDFLALSTFGPLGSRAAVFVGPVVFPGPVRTFYRTRSEVYGGEKLCWNRFCIRCDQ